MQIKRNVLAAGLVAGSLSMGAAHAIDMSVMNDMYVGLDVTKTSIAFDTLNAIDYLRVYQSVFTELSPYIGYQIYPSLALELGYYQSKHRPKTVSTMKNATLMTGTTSAKIGGIYLDALTQYNVWEGLDLLGGLGIENVRFKSVNTNSANLTANILSNHDNYAARLSLGLGYDFNHHLSARIMARANNATLGSIAHYVMHYSAGIQYAL